MSRCRSLSTPSTSWPLKLASLPGTGPHRKLTKISKLPQPNLQRQDCPLPITSLTSRIVRRPSVKPKTLLLKHWPVATTLAGLPKTSKALFTNLKRTSFASESSRVSPVSTVVTKARFVRSTLKLACYRVHTVLLFSHAERRRQLSLQHSAQVVTHRSLMRSKASAKNRSCCITTSLRSA